MREKTIYEKIAEKYNTTPEEVRREMQIAIDAGFDNPDPAVQEEWKKMTLKGDRPTPEEVIKSCIYGYLHFSAYLFWCCVVLFCNLLINSFLSHSFSSNI